MYHKIIKTIIAVIITTVGFSQDTSQQIIQGRQNDKVQQTKPYVILISADGFRADFTEKYNASFLKTIEQIGVRAKYMQPSFPSVTFPNHYTIATGLYPSHHGIVDNNFIDIASGFQFNMSNKKMATDGKWYGGSPIWVMAEQQKMISASYYWVGSEAEIQGIKPTYHFLYNDITPIQQRIQTVKNWLSLPEDKRPHLITFYFPDVDHDAHSFGPENPLVQKSVQFVDSSINALQNALAPLNLPINYIFVSDHGMTTVDVENTLGYPGAVNKNEFNIPWSDALLHLYAKDSSKIMSTYAALKKDTNFKTYLFDETPDYWHYKKSDDWYNRLGDIILVPNTIHRVFNLGTRKPTPGKHGFDNKEVDMRASFMAWGPAFKKGLLIEGFENVNVYPLIANILGLKIDEQKIDGKLNVLKPILAPAPITMKAAKNN